MKNNVIIYNHSPQGNSKREVGVPYHLKPAGILNKNG